MLHHLNYSLQSADMKTALVLNGGGAKGAFETGAIKVLMDHHFEFNMIAGVSAGALNGSMLATDQADPLFHLWQTITESDITTKPSVINTALRYVKYKIGIGKPPMSFASNSALFQLVRRYLTNRPLKIPFTAGRVNLRTGEYVNEIHMQHLVEEVVASTAEPIVWPPVDVENGLYVDGGVRNISPLHDVLGQAPDRIIIIGTEPLTDRIYHKDLKDIVDIAQQTLNILLNEVLLNDIERYLDINEIIKQVGHPIKNRKGKLMFYFDTILIFPEETLGDSLDFSRESLDNRWKLGMKAAEKAISEVPPQV